MVNNKFSIFDIAADENNYWFCDNNVNALFCMNKETFKTKCIKILPFSCEISRWNYSSIALYKNLIIIAPLNQKKIVIFDSISSELSQIEIKIPEEMEGCYNLFRRVVIENNQAYLIPCRYPAIVQIDLDIFELTYHTYWFDLVKKNNYDTKSKPIIYNSFYSKTGNLYLPGSKNQYWCSMSLPPKECSIEEFGKYKEGIFSIIECDNKDIWYSPLGSNEIICFRNGKHETISINDFNEGNRGYWLHCKDEYVYALPTKGDTLLKINCLNNSINNVSLRDIIDIDFSRCAAMMSKLMDDTIIICYESGVMCGYNTNIDEIYQIKYSIPKNLPDFYEAIRGTVSYESEDLGLNTFLDYIK